MGAVINGNTVIPGFVTSTPGNRIGLERAAFYNALLSIAFNNGTIEELFRHGLSSITNLLRFTEKDLEKFAKSVLHSKSPDATDDIFFPIMALTNLTYLRLWGELREMCDLPLDCSIWDDDMLTYVVDWKKELEAAKIVKDLDDPPKLPSMKKWEKFHEGLLSYLRTKQGSNNIPLVYVVRPDKLSLQAIFDESYENEDER